MMYSKTEEDTFNALKKWSLADFRRHVIANPYDFVGDRIKRDHECTIRGWTWGKYIEEYNKYYFKVK